MREREANTEDAQNLLAQSQLDMVHSQREIVQVGTEWDAPLPSPVHFQGYEDTLPGAANRILEMAENEQNHRHQQEMSALRIGRTSIVGDSWKSYLGMALGFVIAMTGIICGTYLAANGHDTSGMTFLVASLASLVGVSIYGIRAQSAERKRNAKEE